MPKLTITVTQAMIDRARKRDARVDPIAEAVKAAVPGARAIAIDLASIGWTASGARAVCLTPRSAREAILAFDRGERIAPFTFMLKA